MTIVKATIKSGNKTYVSIELPGYGANNSNFNVAKTALQLLPENFPAFKGTQEEWETMMDNTTEIRIENLGSN